MSLIHIWDLEEAMGNYLIEAMVIWVLTQTTVSLVSVFPFESSPIIKRLFCGGNCILRIDQNTAL